MDFIKQVKVQLTKMSEIEKDEWILSQARLLSEDRQKSLLRLLSEDRQEDFLQSLSGVKKNIGMPTTEEICEFCERVERGEVYFEFEKHYYEFDDDGRYMDDWKTWHNDITGAIPFLNRIFEGCFDLLCLGEYQAMSDILDRVFELKFPVKMAENSEDRPDEEFFTLSEANREKMFSIDLSEVGADWIRAAAKLTEGQDNKKCAQKFVEMLEHPVCQNVKPRILVEEGISQEIFSEMASILENKIAEQESALEEKFQAGRYCHAQFLLMKDIDRKKEMLLDIRVKCLSAMPTKPQKENSKLAACWKQIQEKIKWLSYELYIDDQPEIDEIQNICEALIGLDELKEEDWEVRKKVLKDMIKDEYYDYYSCGDVMEELAEKLCTNKAEYLAFADIMDASYEYKEKAAYLYYQYGREDKYISYLESNLYKRSKEYTALITYYRDHNQQEDARRVAELGLERCKEDLTDIFIYLLLDAQKNEDQKRFQKFYASAKRRKRVNLEAIKDALHTE